MMTFWETFIEAILEVAKYMLVLLVFVTIVSLPFVICLLITNYSPWSMLTILVSVPIAIETVIAMAKVL